MIRVLLYLAIIVQLIALYYAIRLVRVTKYNAIWILFIIGFLVLGVQRVVQLWTNYGHPMPVLTMTWFDIAVSLCVSVGIVLLDKLFIYIDRLNHHRQLMDRRILTAVLRTEEKTRANFSKELHDGLGPLLSSAKISLSALSHSDMTAEQRDIFNNTLYVVDEALRSLREISNNLSPHALTDFGLARGIQIFVDKAAALHKVKISFATNLRGERYDPDIEVIMYRVVCELITNSLKHSGCSEIRLSLSVAGDTLEMQYSDNGRGFDPQAMMDCGMGLSNINSRVSSLNGTFDIRSSKGRGMCASVKVNVRGAERLAPRPAAIETPRPVRAKRRER
ncbi:MAG: two-component sensor histidine kinase [Bacteroidales bacterium 55_9]|nr:MAG: two-component sensor histidine kinase [Bacteroidales bacterium 55_9]HJC77775.1 sensor histidine kinase [Candidatus Alistipes merdipullorum]